jgi:L-alanine-DL-glutamate epimerase-like enolase superfamily enzyme
MKITALETIRLDEFPNVLWVRVHTDEGLVGLGETFFGARAVEAYLHESAAMTVLGRDPFAIERIGRDLTPYIGFAGTGAETRGRSAVDIALWDLKAKYYETPLYQLLGPYTESVPVYGSGGWTHFSLDELVAEQCGYVERGMKAVKMKVGKDFGQSEQEDVARLAAVREAVGPDVQIYIDANNGYYAKQAIRMARTFEQYGVGWFEEPVLADDIEGLAAVARAIDIPVASGEHEYTKYGFRDLIARGGADIVQPDVGRVGGISEWMKVAHLAHAFNLPVAPHAYQLIHLHLACATPNLKVVEYLGTVEAADRIFYTSFDEPQNGVWSPDPDKHGLGLELDPVAIKKYSV